MANKDSIFVLGGTGFVGEKVVDVLLKNGKEVSILVRNLKKVKKNWIEKVNVVEGDLGEVSKRDLADLLKKYKPSTFVYCIGLIRETKNAKFIDLHYRFVSKAIELGKRVGAENFILISANGVELIDNLTGENYKGYKEKYTDYQLTKALGEIELLRSNLNFKTLRPSIVWDKSKKYNFRTVITQLIKFKIVPVFGKGDYRMQPISRTDLANRIDEIITNSEFDDKAERLCGKEIYTYKELIQKVAQEENKKVLIVNIPIFIAKPAIKFASLFPFSPISYDQFRMLINDNICN